MNKEKGDDMSKEVRQELAKAAGALADAVRHITRANETMQAAISALPPGHELERVALGIARAANHLSEAAAAMPDEAWAAMIIEAGVDHAAVARALETAGATT